MADSDNTPDDGTEPQSKPFVVPATAGVVGGIAGGVATSRIPQLLNKEKIGAEVVDAKAAHKKAAGAYDDAVKKAHTDTALKELHDKVEEAKKAHNSAKEAYSDALGVKYDEAVAKLKPQVQVKLLEENTKYNIKLLKSKPASPARDWLIKAAEEKLKKVEELGKDPNLTAETIKKFDLSILGETSKAAGEPPAGIENLTKELTYGFDQEKNAFEALKKVDPEGHKAIVEALKEQHAALEKTAEELKKAEAAYAPKLEAVVKTEQTAAKTAEKTVNKLSALENIGKEENTVLNVLKRPIGLLKNGSNGVRVAIVGGTVALGGAVYLGTRAMMSPKKSSESFVDREQQRDISRGTGAAPAV